MVQVLESRINFFRAFLVVMVSLKTTIPAYSSSSSKMEKSNYSAAADNASNRIIRSAMERSLITTGSGKIFMIVNSRYLQIFADGAVNGTDDEKSDHAILERKSVDTGKVLIQGVMTCSFLCMDPCGLVYSLKEPTDECVFDESVEMDAFNTYSSAKHSNYNHTDYFALNDDGKASRIRRHTGTGVGKLDRYTLVLPEAVKAERMKKLELRKRSNFRHRHVCPSFSLSHLKTAKSRKCKRRKKSRLKGPEREETARNENGSQKRGKQTKRRCHQQQK